MTKPIKRFANLEIRASETEDRSIEGFASVFDEETNLGWFYEKIDRDAFKDCDMSDVYLLMNHDPNIILAGTQNGSLSLSVENKGLHQTARVTETSQGNDYLQLVKEGLIRKMSFAFTIDQNHGDEWYTDENGMEHRTIKKIDKLYDVSIVTYPAYGGTSVRSMDELDEIAKSHFEERKMEKEKIEVREEPADEVVKHEEEEQVEEVVEAVEPLDTIESIEPVVEETTEKDDVQEDSKEEERMNTNFGKVELRTEGVQAWRKSVMTGIMEERAGIKSTDAGVPVPEVFQSYIERAWETADLLTEVSISTIKGIFKVSHEVSATGAVYHAEGASAPAEEEVVLATVRLIPRMLKKWISVTDELEAMTDEEFMRYIAEEVVYQIVKKLEAEILVGAGQGDDHDEGVVGISKSNLTVTVKEALTFNSLNEALAEVDAGSNPLIVMNRETFFKNILGLADTSGRPIYQIMSDNAGKPLYLINGIRVKFNDAIPAYATASENATWAIVGDFKAYRLNMPNGQNVQTLFDPYTLATEDKSRMIGKLFVAGGVTKPKAFAKLTKTA